ncbi:hypothetical protein KFE25_007187 [Diacronema lutheri]|uniref:Fe2OG dioxygenase domain-containing protein n=1 Tax=Diacronema lutheri TaxID=2081491 RepID=A0A8J5XUE2_DIALT|nr:hypothetical protein KFE25_007187 [Diacronema lutheri]
MAAHETHDLDSLLDEDVLRALSGAGAFSVRLPNELVALNAEVLRWFGLFDAQPSERKQRHALVPDGTGENNGWHGPGGLSAYNRFRDGYIFQASEPIWSMLDGSAGAEFAAAHERWRAALHAVGHALIARLARALEVGADQFGPGGRCDIAAGAQFHLKAIRAAASELCAPGATGATADGRMMTLPAHRDPSVLSLVVATRPGLQLLVEGEGRYEDVPRCGPDVCTVIAGQLLTKLTRGLVRSPLHRVVSEPREAVCAERVAATFFFQPPLDAVLQPLESPTMARLARLADASPERSARAHTKVRAGGERGNGKPFLPVTYREWKHRAYSGYYARAAASAGAARLDSA